jgi:hypothetical protein
MRFRKRKYQLGGAYMPNKAEAASEQQTNALIGGVSAVNPVIGTFMQIGQGIGKTTMNEDGLYHNKAGQFIDNSINPATGIQNLKDVLKNPTGENIANQLSLGLIGKGATQQRREEAKQDRLAAEARAFETQMNGKLAGMNYDFDGNQQDSSIYQTGGRLIPLNSDTVEVDGATHEQGGVEVAGAELEDNETVANGFVYSDYLGFADRHKTLAQQIGKIEKKPLNRERRVTMEILRKKEKALQHEQESLKESLGLETGKAMQLGGYLRTETAPDYLSSDTKIGMNEYTNVGGPWKDTATLRDTLMQGFGTGKAYTDPEGRPTLRDVNNPKQSLDNLNLYRSVVGMMKEQENKAKRYAKTPKGAVEKFHSKFFKYAN